MDQLQHHRSCQLVGQSCYHHSGIDLWHTDLAVVFCSIGNQYDTDLGQQQEIAAHSGWIQHTLDLVELYGFGTEFSLMMNVWQQQIFDRIVSGGVKPKELVFMTTGRGVGKSQMSQQAIDRLMRDLNSQPITGIVTGERRVHGSRFYTAQPQGGSWLDMEAWVCEHMGPGSSVWALPEQLGSCRWFANDRRFWFRQQEDLVMFLMRWR